MKKLLFGIAAFFVLTGLFSCADSYDFRATEQIEILLPDWNSCNINLELSCWKIICGNQDNIEEFLLSKNTAKFSKTVTRNTAFFVLAQPVCKNNKNQETIIFKPAGAFYPYLAQGDYNDEKRLCVCWEGGFSAFTMYKIILNCKENQISDKQTLQVLMQFNWKKLQQTIEKNIISAKEANSFYNPWHIGMNNIVEGICSDYFTSSLLDSKNIYFYSLKNPCFNDLNLQNDNNQLYSNYVPENSFIIENNSILLKKNNSEVFILNNEYSILMEASSSKNISLQINYLPIFISDEKTNLYMH